MSGPLGSSQWMYSSGAAGYQINDSLRFEDGSGAYLSRTPATAGNTTTYTVSFWIKGFDLREQTIMSAENGASQTFIKLRSDGQIQFGAWNGSGYDFNLRTTALHRDPSAFYHFVCVMDGGNATSSDRQRIYVNGERRTSFTHEVYTTSGQEINTAVTHYLGRLPVAGSTQYLSALLSDVYFIDGQALDPTDFGETIDGYWRPIAYAGTYGTNGFHLELNGNSNDSSGNGNDWTAASISAHDYVPDTPTNSFATYNINVNTGQSLTYEEGNLNNSASGSFWSSSVWQQSSLGVTGGANAGKYYFEYCTTASGSGQATGVAVQSSRAIDTTAHNDGVIYYYLSVKTGNTVTVSGISNNPTYDVLRFAFDASNGKVWIGNSTGWFNSGDPAAGTNESGTIAISDSHPDLNCKRL